MSHPAGIDDDDVIIDLADYTTVVAPEDAGLIVTEMAAFSAVLQYRHVGQIAQGLAIRGFQDAKE